MTTKSIETLTAWLAEKPRALGWDAILAYDRTKANALLMQEYIARFNVKDGYLVPVTSEITGTSPVEYFSGVVLSAPILSFEGSTISSSKARLTFDLVGGGYITLVEPAGSLNKQVSQISELNPLAGPKLWLDIDLSQVDGDVDEVGVVQLDLSTTTLQDWHSTVGGTDINKQKVAEYFYALFDQLEPQYKTFVLNIIKTSDSPLLKPDYFAVCVHPKDPGQESKEGEVLLFVTMEGGANGTLPVKDEDFMYLIPDEGGYSATMLLGSDTVFSHIFSGGIFNSEYVPQAPDVELVKSSNGFIDYLNIMGGSFSKKTDNPVGLTTPRASYVFDLISYYLPFGTESESVTCRIEYGHDGKLIFKWAGTSACLGNFGYTLDEYVNDYGVQCTYTWDINLSYGFIFTRDMKLSLDLFDADIDNVKINFQSIVFDPLPIPAPDDIKSIMADIFTPRMRGAVYEFCTDIMRGAEQINVLNLQSLLFSNQDAAIFNKNFFTGELALFGAVSPQSTTYSVAPLSPIMTTGQTLTFTVEPPNEKVTWTVESTDGATDGIGTIDAKTGKYTAPDANELDGNFTRVRVTATEGEYKSSALVSVSNFGVMVNPLIQVATAGDEKPLMLQAGSVLGKPADFIWSFKSAQGGAKLFPADDGTCAYTPGPATEQPYRIDTVRVTSGETSNECVVLVVNGKQALDIRVDAVSSRLESAPTQVQLVALSSEQSPVKGVKWTLLAGSGSVDEDTGVFTADLQGTHRYAVVTGVLEVPVADLILRCFIILPLPIIPLSQAVTLLNN